MDAQRRTALICVTQVVGCALCVCDWGIKYVHSSLALLAIIVSFMHDTF